MRYHAHMQFRVVDDESPLNGQTGVIQSIDFVDWWIELLMQDGQTLVIGRQKVALVNHEQCDAPSGCNAHEQRTEAEP